MHPKRVRPPWFAFVAGVGVLGFFLSALMVAGFLLAAAGFSVGDLNRCSVGRAYLAVSLVSGYIWVLFGPLLIIPAVIVTVRADASDPAVHHYLRWMALSIGLSILSWLFFMSGWSGGW